MQKPPDKRIKMVIMQFFCFIFRTFTSNYRPGKNSDLGLWSKHLSNPGWAHDSFQSKSGLPPVFTNDSDWDTATPICSCVICGCFHAIAAKLGSSDRDHMAKPK